LLGGLAWLAQLALSRGTATSNLALPLTLGAGSAGIWSLVGLASDAGITHAAVPAKGGYAAEYGVALVLLVMLPLLLLWADRAGVSRPTLAALLLACTAAAVTALQCGADALAFGDLPEGGLLVLATAWGLGLLAAGARSLASQGSASRVPSRRVVVFCALVGVALPPLVSRLQATLGETPSHVGPSALIITADALRASSLALYGGPVETPALELMAREGALFTRAYSLSPWTMPSIAGLFSSKYPPGVTPGATPMQVAEESVLHAKLEDYWLEDGDPGLFRRLGERGYVTAAYVGNAIVTNHEWLLRGAGELVAPGYDESERRGPLRSQPRLMDLLARIDPGLAERREVDTTRIITERALAFLRRNRQSSFLLWLHYYDPHAPLDPPARYRTQEGPFEVFPPPHSEGQGILERLKLGQEQLPYILSLYESEIRYLDDAIAQLRRALQRQGREDDTFVFFTSDHGEEFMEHTGVIGHGHTFFEELVAVPLILTGPGIAPRVIEPPVSGIDFLPTLEELLGEARPAPLHGRSLAQSLGEAGAPPAPRPAFMQTNSTFVFSESQRAVVRGDHKLIHAQVSDEVQLYDLAADPEERNDLATRRPELAAELKALLEEWAAGFPSSYAVMRGKLKPEIEQDELDEDIEQLKAIGYLE
jgi:arylsulfatase A-like enzyme